MTVFDNLAFGLRVKPRGQRPDDGAIKRKVHALLGLVQLDWLADRYPSQLSSGQRHTPGATGITARLDRTVVVGPIARLELVRLDTTGGAGDKDIIEAQLGAQEYKALGLREGDTVVINPRKARVFVEAT